MTINDPVYIKSPHFSSKITILRCNNIVSKIDECEIIIITNYDVIDKGFYDNLPDLLLYSQENNKKIYYDSTTELISGEFIEKIKMFSNLKTLNLFGSGVMDQHKENLEELTLKGCEVTIKPFFLIYYDQYTPISTHNELKHKTFLMLGGKSKIARTALTGIVYSKGLDKYGYISYFGFKPNTEFSEESVYDYFMSDSPDEQKDRVKSGLLKMGGNKTIDVNNFDYNTSHSREYNSNFYNNVDFVIIMESDVTNDRVFITEKTTKCIQLNKKFILLSSCGMLEKTKEFYKEYHNMDISHLTDWCDTSYDKISNVWERIDKISNVIESHCHDNNLL